MSAKKTLLLVYTHYRTFVKKDNAILKKYFQVTRYHYQTHKKLIPFLGAFIKQLIYLVGHIKKFDLVYCWFADYHGFLPVVLAKIFNKKSVVVAGGYDTAAIPYIRYGIFMKKNLRAWMASYIYRSARHIIAMEASFIQGENTYLSDKPMSNGILHFVRQKNLIDKCTVIPNCCDAAQWYKPTTVQKQKTVLSVGAAPNVKTFQCKGFDLLLAVAQQLPEVYFMIIGLQGKALSLAQKTATPNVTLLSYIPNASLMAYYAHAKVFCQFSIHEAFPNTLCEAMLCECIPLGTNVNGIPHGIGNTGFILNKKNITQAKNLIQQALHADESLGKAARKRIIQHFSVAARQQGLLNVLNSV